MQVKMCQDALTLLIHLNSKYSSLNGYNYNLNSRPTFAARDSMQSVYSRLAADILYASSGALWNLSRNAECRILMYNLELSAKARKAAVDVLEASLIEKSNPPPHAVPRQGTSPQNHNHSKTIAGVSNLKRSSTMSEPPLPVPQMHLSNGEIEALSQLLEQPLETWSQGVENSVAPSEAYTAGGQSRQSRGQCTRCVERMEGLMLQNADVGLEVYTLINPSCHSMIMLFIFCSLAIIASLNPCGGLQTGHTYQSLACP
jgi:hypothetical protein